MSHREGRRMPRAPLRGYCLTLFRSQASGSIPDSATENASSLYLRAALLLLLFRAGSWAPSTNLTYCVLGKFLLTPPSGGTIDAAALARRAKNVASLAGGRASVGLEGKRVRRRRPNVIMVVHESLGGSALQSSMGREAAPFYHGTMAADPNVYAFRRARTVSGVTPIATPAILTGLLPYDDDGVAAVKLASPGAEFRAAGYDTASFVSYGLDWRGTMWSIVTDLLVPGFGTALGPKELGKELVNEYGMDDRQLLLPYMKDWIRTRRYPPDANLTAFKDPVYDQIDGVDRTTLRNLRVETDSGRKPFFSVLVTNNNHFPGLRHENYTGVPKECLEQTDDWNTETDDWNGKFGDLPENKPFNYCSDAWARYYSAIRTVDDTLRDLFSMLKESGELDNTIIVGAGDHGDTPGEMKRLSDVDAPILDVPLWMHVPRSLLPSRAYREGRGPSAGTGPPRGNQTRPGDRAGESGRAGGGVERGGRSGVYLRDNIDRTVSVLDIMPTLRDLLDYTAHYSPDESRKCATGRSLLSDLVPEGRVIPGWQGPPIVHTPLCMFSTGTTALVYYATEERVHQSKVLEYRFDDDDPMFKLYERHVSELDAEEAAWWNKTLHESGWADHGLVRTNMPHLLNGLLAGS